jgi:hypothetical protein
VLDHAGIDYAGKEPETALRRVPAAMPPPAGQARLNTQKLYFPLPAPERVAVLGREFRAEANIREFARDDIERLRVYAPEALVLPLDAALSLADQQTRGLLDLPELTTAIIVLTSLADSPLAEHHRDLLWRAFRVPVFEQLRGWDGAIIARECEVHDGLHIEELVAILQLQDDELLVTQLTASETPVVRARTGLTGELVTGHCECGVETLRLRRLTPLRVKTAAATA